MLHYQDGEWQVVTPPPDAAEAWTRAIRMVAAMEGWAVADRLFLHYPKGAWEGVPSPTTQARKVIDKVSAGEGWAATTEGTFVHYAGGSWQVADRPITEAIDDLDMASSDRGWGAAECSPCRNDGMRYAAGQGTLERHGLYLPGLSKLAPWRGAAARD